MSKSNLFSFVLMINILIIIKRKKSETYIQKLKIYSSFKREREKEKFYYL